VAVRLARLAGRSLGGGVLLLNSVESESRMDDGGEVALGPLPGRCGDARALNPRLLAEYWQCLAERADLIILDAPPLLSSPLAQALAPTVDGVVLVVAAERTRAADALEAKAALAAGGANILGVVLNKRPRHVPRALYERL
jgi:MinD-like ATPase involved in chromosome partitioning or flagellar assembly